MIFKDTPGGSVNPFANAREPLKTTGYKFHISGWWRYLVYIQSRNTHLSSTLGSNPESQKYTKSEIFISSFNILVKK